MTLRWIDDIDEGKEREVGQKAAGLASLARAGLDVPRGFVVTAPTFEEFVRDSGLEQDIERAISSVDRDDLDAVRRAANRVRSLILDAPVPDELEEELHDAYEKINMSEEVRNAGGEAIDLVGGQRETEFVAVRASPTGARIPGAHRTELNVNGKDALVETVKEVWASLYAAEALAVEDEVGAIHSMAVVVQRMVEPDVSGTGFTASPVGGGTLVESIWGLGSALADGTTTPDKYLLEDGRVQQREIATKGWKVVRDPTSGKTLKQRVSSGDREAETLDGSDVSTVQEALETAEHALGGPVRLDFALSRGRLHALDVTVSAPGETERGREREGIVRGRGAAPGTASGPVSLIYSDSDIDGIEPGAVVVTANAEDRFVPLLGDVAGVVADEGGISSNLAALARILDVPCIVGTGNGTDMLTTGETVTLDAAGGLVMEGEVSEEPAQPAMPDAGASTPDDLLTATRVAALDGSHPDADAAILTDYTSGSRAAELARQHRPGRVWARTDPAPGPDNLGVLAAGTADVAGKGVVLRSYGDVMRAADLSAAGAELLALDVAALRGEDDGAIRNAVNRLGEDARDAETALLMDEPDPELIQAAVAAGVTTIAAPEHRLADTRRAVAQAEKRFLIDRLREL